MRAGDTAAQNDDFRRGNARNAAQQHTVAAVSLLQAGGTDLNRHTAGHFAHRGEQRQRAVRSRNGLVGDRGRAGLHQRLRLRGIRGEVQIGKQNLARAQHLALGELRLLDLDDELRATEHVGRRLGNGGARGAILRVIHADAVPGAGLDDHLMSGSDELADSGGHQAHTVLMHFDLSRNTDTHATTLECED